MTAGEQIAGVATYGHPRTTRRPVELTPRPTVCEVCLTDTEVDVCPDDCPTRQVGRRRED